MTRPSIPVWLDCDPGHDDATAILLAGHTPGLELLGVSTIGGNQTLAKVTKNALDVLDAVGLSHIDVVAGQPRPLMRPPLLCPEIHGDTGLDGPGGGRLLPRSPRSPLPGKAITVISRAIEAAYEQLQRERTGQQQQQQQRGGEGGGGEGSWRSSSSSSSSSPSGERVRLVCTGALTNAALLLTVYPELSEMVEVVIMGGCMGVGNTGPVVEFNIQTDPEAAKIVFESGVPLTMVPLEVTHTVLATPQVLAAIGGIGGMGATAATAAAAGAVGIAAEAAAAAGPASAALSTAAPPPPSSSPVAPAAGTAAAAASPFRHTIQQLLLFFAETYKRVFRFEHPPLHDPVAVAYVIRPDLFECRRMRVDVETCSSLSYGQTVCDVWGQSAAPPNVNVVLQVDVEGVWRLLLEAVARADAGSPLNRAGTGAAAGADGAGAAAVASAGAAAVQEQQRQQAVVVSSGPVGAAALLLEGCRLCDGGRDGGGGGGGGSSRAE
ncbi:hypothetical protein PLESTB_000659200 [Pleodorina starrii]|uniref:Inosine/uridine-preferring nucleoside hydrolase domain-containing protein n=1 Tax=Pleodorina starrii TaxID=330485 RepID=A0A9W6BJ43_9CHLO|nr:hypothetical protein PLESTM_001321300 [Pleodorina starrii]GLC52705.1 hypothetical protein PLESTB_000659200 [Pleodorina starrii]GLC71708.1 hypothetical protein PLESTF_001151800 [Pleodorina starrii]